MGSEMCIRDSLLELQELAHVTIQVVPFSAGAHVGMNGSILLLDFETEPPVLFLDSHSGILSTAKPRRCGASS